MLLGIVLDRSIAASTGVDLCLDDGDWTAQLLERVDRFGGGAGHNALGHGNARFAQNFLALEFVNFHRGTG